MSQLAQLEQLAIVNVVPLFFHATSSLADALSSPNLGHSLQRLVVGNFKDGSLIEAVLPQLVSLNYIGFFDCILNFHDNEAIATACCIRKCMNRIGLNMNTLGDAGMNSLLPAIAANTESLHSLLAYDGGLTDDGCRSLSSFLSSTPLLELQELAISDNDFATSVVDFSHDVLTHLPALEQLEFFANCIGDDGAVAIASTFPCLQHLHKLDLSQNDMSDSGASALAVSLHHLPHLQQLDLSENQIGNSGLLVFLQLGISLPPPPASLQCIDLSYNIGDPPIRKLTKKQKHRFPFIKIRL